jgi:hypothetical protein
MEHDFEPATAARNKSNGYHLLILDSHNSHCTYKFCKFAADHCIIVICLPSHTTHALQPCNVGVFGPLAACWKSEVNKASREHTPITKQNLLVYYNTARRRAFQPFTILSAFAKTGIWPVNTRAIPPEAFEPSLNTTTQSTQPLPAVLPPLLVPIAEAQPTPSPSASSSLPSKTPSTLSKTSIATSATSSTATESLVQQYTLVGIPEHLPHTAS